MSWAGGRRFVILLIVGAIVIAFLTILSFSVFYEAPSCSDNKQNQGESGVDCGNPCALRCVSEEQVPTVLFTKAVSNGQGRIDVAAEIENKNPDASAKSVPYRVTLYGAGQILVGEANGTVDLPPNASVPIFVPGVASGNQPVTGAFLEIVDPGSLKWYAMQVDPRIVPIVSAPKFGGTESAPRVEATLSNVSTTVLRDVRVVVFVRDSSGAIIGASSTVVPTVPAQGQATALFTWSGAFTGVPALIEVTPVIPLP